MNASAPPVASPAHRAWRRFVASRSARLGAALVLLLALAAAGAGLIAPYEVNARHGAVAEPPSWRHWLGTDDLEKDVLTRVLHGARLSLLAGVVSIALAMAIGVPLGAVAGYLGGAADSLVMRGVDVLLTFPGVLVALLLAAALQPGWGTVIIAVGLINVPVFARQIRATVLTVRHLEYVEASRALGATPGRILAREILPSLISPIIVLASLGMGAAILEVAGLSFLGIGGDPTEAEWGAMLAGAKSHWRKNLAFALGPGAAISLSVLGFNLLGDGLRDALDPHLEKRA